MSDPGLRTTITEPDRIPGNAGPPPPDGHTEIRWARMDGYEVVVKASCEPHRARLRREAEVLRRIADTDAAEHVVSLTELTEGPDHTELVTVRHGTVTLAEAALLGLGERVEALIATCEAVAALHCAGWTHGSLEPGHVLLAPPRSPGGVEPLSVRLCSFGDACDDRTPRGAASTSADRHGLATLVLDSLESSTGFGTARERRRYRRGARVAHKRIAAARGLHDPAAIADILSETIGRRMRRAEPHDEAPADTDRRRATRRSHRCVRGPASRSSRGTSRWRTRSLALAAAGCICAGWIAAWVLGHGDADSAAAPEACTVEVVSGAHPCTEVEVHHNVVEVGGARFELGGAQDAVMVGDWDCDGTGTAVLLEHDSGSLFHFDSWSTSSEQVAGRLLGTFESATGLREGAPCAYPEVELADHSSIRPLDGAPDASGAAD